MNRVIVLLSVFDRLNVFGWILFFMVSHYVWLALVYLSIFCDGELYDASVSCLLIPADWVVIAVFTGMTMIPTWLFPLIFWVAFAHSKPYQNLRRKWSNTSLSKLRISNKIVIPILASIVLLLYAYVQLQVSK